MSQMSDLVNEVRYYLLAMGISQDDELEVSVGGACVYEIEGTGTRWSPEKGTVTYNDDSFIVIRRPKPVESSKA